MKLESNNILSCIKWFGAASGSLVPGYTFFTSYPPPIFPMISILTSVLSAAIIYIIYSLKAERLNKLISKSILCLASAFVMLSIYMVLLQYCSTIPPQRDQNQRLQIGFWECDWSLTQYGIKLKQKNPYATPQELLLMEGFSTEGTEKIWEQWSIISAGILMLIIYMVGFVLWTAGFSFLAKHKTFREEGDC